MNTSTDPPSTAEQESGSDAPRRVFETPPRLTREEILEQNPEVLRRVAREIPIDIKYKLSYWRHKPKEQCVLTHNQADRLRQLLPTHQLQNEVLAFIDELLDQQHTRWISALDAARKHLEQQVTPLDDQIAALTAQLTALRTTTTCLRNDISSLSAN